MKTIKLMFAKREKLNPLEKAHSHLIKCIEQRDWKGVLKWRSTLETFQSCNVNNRQILHLVCRFQPPAKVVNAIIRVYPLCLEEVDSDGYTALHTAAEWGASHQVIQSLVYHYPNAASMKEERGKTPLHLYCEKGYLNRFQHVTPADENYDDCDSPVEVVVCIMNAALMNIADEDKEGLTALEYAINCGADYRFVRTLQKYSTRVSKIIRRHEKNT